MKRVLLSIIRFYQRRLSPLTPPCCRFFPSCSHYAEEAVERYGSVKGLWLSAKRILRCNPFCRSGYDPVPDLPARRRPAGAKRISPGVGAK